jgi:uncharacterized lipoprotein
MMRRASWILGSLTIVTLAACGGGNRADEAAPGTGSETGTMSDTATMAPSTGTPMDTAMTGTGTGMDTTGDTTRSH